MNGIAIRFFSKVNIENGLDGCWEYGKKRGEGRYGAFYPNRYFGKQVGAHRWSYEWFYNVIIPDGMFMDHICRNRGCVRPDHIRVVTPRQNVLENSHGTAANNLIKTKCKHGHYFSLENTYIDTHGNRVCRTCQRASNKIFKDKTKEKTRSYNREYRLRMKLS